MVKWCSDWLNSDKKDCSGNFLRLWASNKSDTSAHCHICSCDLKFVSLRIQALLQHAASPKHKTKADIRFSNTVWDLAPHPQPFSITSCAPPIVVLNLSLSDKVTAAVTSWLFKVDGNNLSLLREMGRTPLLFQRMFSDRAIANKFTMSRQKASYTVSDGIGPLLEKKLLKIL